MNTEMKLAYQQLEKEMITNPDWRCRMRAWAECQIMQLSDKMLSEQERRELEQHFPSTGNS